MSFDIPHVICRNDRSYFGSVRDAAPLRGNELRPAALHGLGAVDAMASRWGVEPFGAAGKTVWVDLHR